MIDQKAVLEALSHVQEPDLKKDLVSLGMIRDIDIKGQTISFTVMLTTPACPLKELIRTNCIEAIHNHLGSQYAVTVNMEASVLSGRSRDFLPTVKNIIAVGSGKGGVGKSTVTVNLAIALAASGARVGLIDADISGPSVPLMFGVEDEPLAMEPGQTREGRPVMRPVERFGVKMVSIGFVAGKGAAIPWRGPMMSKALQQFFTDVNWGELDYLLLDLPPGTSDVHLTLVQTVPVTGAVIVTTPQKVALADAEKALGMFQMQQINVPVLGVVENMAWFTPEELPNNRYYIFGEGGGGGLAEHYGVPLLGQIPLVQRIRESGDSGFPAALDASRSDGAAFKALAEELARQVSIRNAQMDPTKPVAIVE